MFLGSTYHPEEVLEQLNDSKFAERFGDIRLVFKGGEVVDYYRALLSLLSQEWRQLLQQVPTSDTVLLTGMEVNHFFNYVPHTEQPGSKQDQDCLEINTEAERENASNFLSVIKIEPLNNFVEDLEEKMQVVRKLEEEKVTETQEQVVNLSGQSGPAYLPGILEDFPWPGHLAGPGHHSMGWRKAPGQSGDILNVLGNRSLHTVLAEQGDLPELAAFLLPHQEEPDRQLGGVLHIRDFINGQAATSCAAFQLEGQGGKVSLDDLLKLGCHELASREGPGYNDVASKVLVYMGSSMTNLRVLVDGWKQQLLQDTRGKVLENFSQNKANVRAVIGWLENKCLKSTDGAVVCCYCGFICYKQATLGNVNTHIRTHLFREKITRKNLKKRERQCLKCGKQFRDPIFFKRHMNQMHGVVIREELKECLFCNMRIPKSKINQHEIDLHLNETITCKLCEKYFPNAYKYRTHQATTHSDRYSGYCKICQKKYQSMAKHNSEQHNGKTFPCNHCSKIFRNKARLLVHEASVNGTLPRKQCPECAKSYINLRDHILTVHKGELKPSHRDKTKCNTCKKRIPFAEFEFHQGVCIQQSQTCSLCFKDVKNLEKHVQSMHVDVKCHVCLEIFPGSALFVPLLRNHIYNNHIQDIFDELQISERLDTEDLTERENIAEYFVRHKSINESNQFICLLCKQAFITRTKITYHMKHHLKYTLGHGKRKYYPCSACGEMVQSRRIDLHKCVIRISPIKENDKQGQHNLEKHDLDQREEEQLEGQHLEQEKLEEDNIEQIYGEIDKLERIQLDIEYIEGDQRLLQELEARQEPRQQELNQKKKMLPTKVIHEINEHKKYEPNIVSQNPDKQELSQEAIRSYNQTIKVTGNMKDSDSIIPRNLDKLRGYSAIPNMNIENLSDTIDSLQEKTGVGEWLCKNCGKKSRDKWDSAEHVQTHIEGLRFSCSDCGFVAKSKKSIRNHIKKKSVTF